MNLVKVLDLIGKPVSGLKADVRSRHADGTLWHEDIAKDRPGLAVLRSITQKTEKNGVWDYTVKPATFSKQPFLWTVLRWEPNRQGIYDCGFSGLREDCEQLQDWHILIEN